MANSKISSLVNYTTPDAVNDVIPIVDTANTQTKKITRNNLLGITGAPLGTTDSQTVSNKTLGNTNTVTVKASLLTLQDQTDTTKQLNFLLSGITTATTRTLTVPNANDTLVGRATVDTLTNKTITGPTITGGSIDNTTVTVDTVSGHTSANTGTVYGVAVTSGTIAAAALASGSVTNPKIAVGAVDGTQLATSAITLGYAQITADVTTASATAVQATGLTTTVTIPTGGRRIKITVYCNALYGGTTNAIMSLWDGVVTSGTQIQSSISPAVTTATTITMIASVTPAAGSKTYNVGFKATGGGTADIQASATAPAFILVEAI